MQRDYFSSKEHDNQGKAYPLNELLDKLGYNADGLVPVIAQQHDSLEVLMHAWMNREAIEKTLQSGDMCYWSRSRQSFWVKGETSGNTQKLIEMRVDCDGDTLLCLVDQQGPACHTNRRDCFYFTLDSQGASINRSAP